MWYLAARHCIVSLSAGKPSEPLKGPLNSTSGFPEVLFKGPLQAQKTSKSSGIPGEAPEHPGKRRVGASLRVHSVVVALGVTLPRVATGETEENFNPRS